MTLSDCHRHGRPAAPRLACAAAVAAALLVAAPGPAEAARPDSRQLTCAQAQSLVARNGAVVMTTGRFTYERFVSGIRFCDRWQTLRPETAPTRDAPRCVVGYVCEQPLFVPFGRDR